MSKTDDNLSFKYVSSLETLLCYSLDFFCLSFFSLIKLIEQQIPPTLCGNKSIYINDKLLLCIKSSPSQLNHLRRVSAYLTIRQSSAEHKGCD